MQARGFLKDAEVMILDEPTSALDPVVEQQIVQSIRQRLARCGSSSVLPHLVCEWLKSKAGKPCVAEMDGLARGSSSLTESRPSRPVIEFSFCIGLPLVKVHS